MDFDDKKWFDLVNRGGLTKCNNDFYEYLRAVELELQMHYLKKMDEKKETVHPSSVTKELTKNESIIQSWTTLGSPEELQTPLTELYVQIRCFAYARKKMELYKRGKGQNLQKSKSFRSKINAGESNE